MPHPTPLSPDPIARTKLAIVVSHPIQHFVPFYRRLAAHPALELRVFFMSNFSLRRFRDQEMGTDIAWEMDLTSGYPHEFLAEADRIDRSSPLTLNNPSVGAALDRFVPDVVLAYGYNQVTSARMLAWNRRRGVPFMLISDSELNRHRDAWRRAAKGLILPAVYRRFSAFLTTGDHNEAYLERYGVPREKMFRSPFTIDEDVYLAARSQRQILRKAFRTLHGIPQDAFVALTVGKLSERKRPMDVAEAAAILKADGRGGQIRFLLAGDGALREAIESRIAREALPVSVLGFVNLDQLPSAYCACDAIVHPAEADPHPLVMSEASCLGLPIVVSDRVGAVGAADIVRADQNGLVTPCGDPRAIADAVSRLAENPELARRMGERSAEIYAELDMRRSVEGLLAAVSYSLRGRRKSTAAAA